ncbi:UNVERIFIED_CONTAM: hypothetical protein ABIC26_003123 [Paenibacillus sp. PvR008]
MKSKYNDFWFVKNNKAANAYMDEVAKESNFTGHHKGVTLTGKRLLPSGRGILHRIKR